MITAELKDKVLKYLVENLKPMQMQVSAPVNDVIDYLELKPEYFDAILHLFNKQGLIDQYKGYSNGYRIDIRLLEPAHQKLQRGGFIMEEQVIKQELIKLQAEVKNLEKKLSKEDLSSLTSIVANFGTTLSLFLQ